MMKEIKHILKDAENGRPITREEAKALLSLPENSLDASLLRATANVVSRRRFWNRALLLGQIGIDSAPCEGDCAFCFFAKSHMHRTPCVLSLEEIVGRCQRFAAGGAQGVFLVSMHRFGFDWFCDLVAALRRSVPADMKILTNVGDITPAQLKVFRDVGVSGVYHVCHLREGVNSCMNPTDRRETTEHIIEAGLDWYNLCGPIGPEHTPEELVEQIWLGVDLPCSQHGAMQRFPIPGSPLYHHGQISLSRLSQIVAVIALATIGQKELKSIAVIVPNTIGLFSGANAFFPETGEPDHQLLPYYYYSPESGKGFTTALWRQSSEITTADCRNMLIEAGFSHLMDTDGQPKKSLPASSWMCA